MNAKIKITMDVKDVKLNGLFNRDDLEIEKKMVYQDTFGGRHIVVTHTKYK